MPSELVTPGCRFVLMADMISQGYLDSLTLWDMVARLGLACLLGFAVGFDRELKSRAAGLRTHMLTSLAAAIFMIISLELIAQVGFDDNRTQLDPLRVIEAVTAGVAFLAAGTIIQAKGSVKGLTTGASMWLSGAIGLACGAGFYRLALLGTGLSLIVLVPIRLFEHRLPKKDKSDTLRSSEDE